MAKSKKGTNTKNASQAGVESRGKAGGKKPKQPTNATGQAKHGKRVTRATTKSRSEVRRDTVARQGHPK